MMLHSTADDLNNHLQSNGSETTTFIPDFDDTYFYSTTNENPENSNPDIINWFIDTWNESPWIIYCIIGLAVIILILSFILFCYCCRRKSKNRNSSPKHKKQRQKSDDSAVYQRVQHDDSDSEQHKKNKKNKHNPKKSTLKSKSNRKQQQKNHSIHKAQSVPNKKKEIHTHKVLIIPKGQSLPNVEMMPIVKKEDNKDEIIEISHSVTTENESMYGPGPSFDPTPQGPTPMPNYNINNKLDNNDIDGDEKSQTSINDISSFQTARFRLPHSLSSGPNNGNECLIDLEGVVLTDLNHNDDRNNWNTKQCSEWVGHIALEYKQYQKSFENHGVDGKLLNQISENEDLLSDIVKSPLHRRKITMEWKGA